MSNRHTSFTVYSNRGTALINLDHETTDHIVFKQVDKKQYNYNQNVMHAITLLSPVMNFSVPT